MDCRVRAGLECQAALIQAEIDLLGVSIDEHEETKAAMVV